MQIQIDSNEYTSTTHATKIAEHFNEYFPKATTNNTKNETEKVVDNIDTQILSINKKKIKK